MQQSPTTPPEALPPAVDLDPLSVLLHASGPVRIVNWLLLLAAVVVWIVAVLKLLELGRLDSAERAFEAEAERAEGSVELAVLARRHPGSPGARLVLSAAREPTGELARASARRVFVIEEQRAFSLLGILSIIGSAGPFVGLFGTVWGILDAFLRIGREKSASLPVVAPAIGEALISTAAGLFAAIPAVIAFNLASKRADDLLARVDAASVGWLSLLKRHPEMEPSRKTPSGDFSTDRHAGEVQWVRP